MAIRAFFRRLFSSEPVRRALVASFIVMLFLGGVQLRRWTGEKTRHVRFQHDIVNGFYWGSETLAEARELSPDGSSADSWPAFFRGYLALYDRVKDDAYEKDYGLDYPPLRLLVMSVWAKQVRSEFPGVDDGHPKLVNPLLKMNLLCELISAVAIFLLVRFWVERSARATRSPFLRGLRPRHRAFICGLAAASVAWLEPSMILAAGAMFKGQLLFVAPFFVLWPLWQKRWTRALRMLSGLIATATLVVSPWLLRTPAAWIAVATVAGLSWLFLLRRGLLYRSAWIAGVIGCAAFVIGAFTGGSFSWL